MGFLLPENAAESIEAIQRTHRDMSKHLIYKQVYLSPKRGWIPIQGDLGYDRAFGDCQDMVSRLTFQLADRDIGVFPALTGVSSGFHLYQTLFRIE